MALEPEPEYLVGGEGSGGETEGGGCEEEQGLRGHDFSCADNRITRGRADGVKDVGVGNGILLSSGS